MGLCSSAARARGEDEASERPSISVRRPGEAPPPRGKCPACKVCLLGDTCAGKTSLVARFTRDYWDPDGTSATIGAAFTSQVIDFPDGRCLQLDIWDTAGQERYRTLAPLYYRNAAGAVVVFDILDARSFESSKVWVRDFREQRPPCTTIVLVGNKVDLDSQREVTQEAAKDYAQANGLLYIETSAKSNLFVKDMFELLASRILERFAPPS